MSGSSTAKSRSNSCRRPSKPPVTNPRSAQLMSSRPDADERHRDGSGTAAEPRKNHFADFDLLTSPMVAHMVLKFVGIEFMIPAWMEVLLATPIQFIIGARFYKAAWKALRAGAANMDVLVVMGTTSAYIYSWYLLAKLGNDAMGQLYFEASAVIITLVLLGKFMESKAKRGTTAAIRQLMDLRPETARVKQP